MTKSRIAAASILALALAGTASATTTFTAVQPPPSGEKSHAQILSQIYGGTFTKASNGRDYSSSTVSAMRLVDSATAAPTSLTTGVSAGDAFWSGPASTGLSAKAKYACDNSLFGWVDGTSGGTFHSLLNTGTLNSALTFNVSGTIRFALKDLTTGRLLTSDPNTNPDCKDQLVTYKITGAGITQPTWLLFWEDRTTRDCADFDYNDSVICITTNPPVPAPAAAGLLGAAGLGAVRRRRR
jgi:MYXO-CTERM domain-containing protein